MQTTTQPEPTPREIIVRAQAIVRSEASLAGAGVRITYRPRSVRVRGNTFPLRAVLQARGFRWDRQLREWVRRYESCAAQEDARSLFGALVRELRTGGAS